MGAVAVKRTDSQIGKAPQYVIDIVNLSKRFKRKTLSRGNYTTIKSALLSMFSLNRGRQERFTVVLEGLTLRIPAGNSVGIIGRNGSGKSTLLKLITGIYKPDTGHVRVTGRVAALIELGAGFHPDFTGRENLYLGGIMHGLSREEIDQRFEDIIKFAELEDVIDDPVRTYSSGMFMRLGFSLAVHTDPDILIIDEVLAVGDAAFEHKCKDKISELHKAGKTLLIVSHDLGAIERWCDEVLWLNDGEVMDRGDPRRVIDHYRQHIELGEELELQEHADKRARAEEESDLVEGQPISTESMQRWGSREIEITSVRLLDKKGEAHHVFHPDDSITVEVSYQVHEAVEDYVFGIGIHRADGVAVFGTNTNLEKVALPPLGEKGRVLYTIDRLGLLDGTYSFDIAVHKQDGYPYDYHKNVQKFAVRWPLKQVGVVLPRSSWKIEEQR